MDEQKALDLIMKLADGVDPRTGAALPAESPYQDAETLRALFMAILALKFQLKHKKE